MAAAAGRHTKQGRELSHFRSQGQQPRVLGCNGTGKAGRSHPASEVRGRRPSGATQHPRSVVARRRHPASEVRAAAERSYPGSEVRGGREEHPEERWLHRHRKA